MTHYLSPRAAAERLSVTTDCIYGHIAAGHLQAVNLALSRGKPRWRISLMDLESFLAGRCARGPMPKVARRKRQAEVIEFYK